MARGKKAQCLEKVTCARFRAFCFSEKRRSGVGEATRPPWQHSQKVIADIKRPACNYLSQQIIIKRADNEEINIFIVEMLYCLLGSLQRRLGEGQNKLSVLCESACWSRWRSDEQTSREMHCMREWACLCMQGFLSLFHHHLTLSHSTLGFISIFKSFQRLSTGFGSERWICFDLNHCILQRFFLSLKG